MTSDLAFYVQKVAAGKKLLLFLFYVLTLQVSTYAYGKSIQQTVTNKQQPLGWSSASLPIILQASRNALEKREWKIEYMWPMQVANINVLIDTLVLLVCIGHHFLPEEIAIKTINRYSTISSLRLRFLLPFLILFLMWCMPLDSKILPCKFSTRSFSSDNRITIVLVVCKTIVYTRVLLHWSIVAI